ncbi:hypothetical protein DIURU_000425 [Diutina rugosa]|uniref:Magnesium transporter protein 1 n=1 Tax=Diutina rugosa TaxID=5481 RepID=A0A642UYC4_DIURU|nr:uncharacterized protein DIURU_000425 [Diutina rugosa]KAA8907738.1 hypothetical protein DIURU_000425 [Diutina rugosa]
MQFGLLLWGWLVATVFAGLDVDTLRKVANSGGSGVIELTDENWEPVLEGPRDYTAILMMTTRSTQVNCVLCNEMRPYYDVISSSYRSEFPSGLPEDASQPEVFFFAADFVNCKTLFQKLQLSSIPKFYSLSAQDKASNWMKDMEEYAIMGEDQQHDLHKWVEKQSGVDFSLHIPKDYSQVITNVVLVAAVTIALYKIYNRYGAVWAASWIWSGLSIIAVLMFTTGYMFTKIRNVPYVREHSSGHKDYILSGQSQMQLGAETQIVSLIYGLLTLLVVLLIKGVPTVTNPAANLIGVAVVSVLIFVVYSMLLSVFGMKGLGYPYKFLQLI